MLTVKLSGYQQAVDVMRQMPVYLQRRTLSSALRSSARPMLVAARQQAPRRSGELRRAIKIMSMRRTRKTETAITLRHHTSKSKRKAKEYAFYARMQHEGTDNPRRPKKAALLAFKDEATGKMIFRKQVKGLPPNHYLDRAYRQTVSRVEREFETKLREAVERYVARNYKLKK